MSSEHSSLHLRQTTFVNSDAANGLATDPHLVLAIVRMLEI